MGARTKILIGVQVSYRDFVKEFKGEFGCSNKHTEELGKFCSQCGEQIGQIIKSVATEHLKKFCNIYDFSEEEFIQCKSLDEVISNHLYDSEDPGIYIASVDWSGMGQGPPDSYVLGVSTLKTESSEGEVDETSSVSTHEFLGSIKAGLKLVSDCGFDTTKMRIYTTKYLTY